MSLSKRSGSDAVCDTKPLDSLKNWNDRFFWVDTFACPASFPWNTSKGVPKDPFPKSFEFNAEHFATLVALPAPFHKYPKPFLCLVGISRYYTLDEDVYPEFLGDNDEEMDLLSFIRTTDPTKVRVAERQHVENEPRLLESTVGRASGDGQGTDIQPVAATTDTIIEDVAPLHPRRQRKRKTVVADASRPSHPPKKLKEDYGALGGASTTATPERKDKSLADSVIGLNLRTIGAPSSAPAIATIITVTATVDADAMTDRVPVAPSLFGVGSSSTGRTDSVPDGFFDVSGSDFLIGGIRTVVDPDSDLQKAELLKVMDGEIESLKAQLLLKEAKSVEAIRLRAEVFKFEAAEKSLQVREKEVADLDAQVTAVKLQNDNLVDQIHELEISSVGLQEKVATFEDFTSQLEKFQDKKMEEVNEKFDKLCADFVDMVLHLEEKFYPHLLTTISGHRWLLTYGMELAVVKCLNSTEYLFVLGSAISKAIEKGMQEGLSARITHGTKGRKLADIAAYNPSVEADYLSAL
nr:transposase (putative), gypsy type [Tanacetum cinerariifolium]